MHLKRTFIFFLILNGMLISIHSQQLADSAVYNSGIIMIRNAKTVKDFKQAAIYFEDLSAHSPSHWLSLYYAALCYIQASHKVEDDQGRDNMLDKAQPLIDRAGKKNPKEPEIFVLQAFLYQSRIQVNPEMRGLTYSRKADANLKQAAAADDGNPRVWSLMGYNVFHTPAVFGGGASKALPLFLKARDRFRSFKPYLPFMPVWGEPENQEMIAECNKSLNQGM
jgi:hypothetical protein